MKIITVRIWKSGEDGEKKKEKREEEKEFKKIEEESRKGEEMVIFILFSLREGEEP